MTLNSNEDGHFKKRSKQYGTLEEYFPVNSDNAQYRSIAINDRGGLIFIPTREILLLEGRGNYTSIHCLQQLLTSSSTLKRFQEKLNPELFIRVHKSYIVNINYIRRYSPKYGGEIELVNGLRVSISRRNRHLLDKFTI